MSNTGEATTTAREQEEQNNQTAIMEQQSQSGTTAPEAQQHQTTDTVEQTGNVQASDAGQVASEPKPDVSDQGYQELLPKLMNFFNNNREELARALGLHRSTVDRWLNGKSRPNNSTILRMRRLAQERRIE